MKAITFPVNRGTKLPACKWGDLTEPVSVPSGYSTGLKTGAQTGLVVIDLDRKNGKDGIEELAKLGPIPATRTVRTPTGGVHLYYKHPGGEVPNSASRLAPGVDVRGDGGYVVAPPSAGYDWVGEPDAPIAPLPDWLLGLLKRGESKSTHRHNGVAQNGTHVPKRIAEGGRNDSLMRLAGKLRRDGLEAEEIRAALLLRNENACTPPLPEEEVTAIATSVSRYESLVTTEGWNAQAVPTHEMLEDVPPPEYLCEALDISPGRPTQILGKASAGKSFFAQTLALSVAAGVPFLGQFPIKKGQVGWVDFEMGRKVTLRRFQQLCKGMRLPREAVFPQLSFVPRPKTRLSSPGSEEIITAFCQGKVLVVVDSLRRSVPGIDENSSEIAESLDILARASDASGATVIFLHHRSTKTAKDEKDEEGMGLGRGSSTIDDGSGSIWSMSGKVGEPANVRHIRPGTGAKRPPFKIQIWPLGDEVVLEYLGGDMTDKSGEKEIEAKAKAILVALAPKPLSKTELRHIVGKHGAFEAAMVRLEADGQIVDNGVKDPRDPRRKWMICAT